MQLIILTFLPVRDVFCGAQNAQNAFSAGAGIFLDPAGELRMLP